MFQDRRRTHAYITTFSAEEVADVPFCAARNHDFAFNWSLATLAAGAEQLVKIQVTIEPRHSVLVARCICESLITAGLWFLIECNALEGRLAVEADETFWMESTPSCSDYLPGDPVGARLAPRSWYPGSRV